MYGYQSVNVPAIHDFHASPAKIRLLSGPNRGGKTTRGAWELVCFATGYHPIRKEKYPTPNVCWAVCLDLKNYGEIVKERLKEWLPAGTEWKQYSQCFHLPKRYGGSRIYLKSAEPGETKFAAEGLLAAWFDEGRALMEGPFQETLARIKPGQPLRVFMTMSPEDGAGGWTWEKFYNQESRSRYKESEVFYFTLFDCEKSKGGHLSAEEIQHFLNTFPEHKREAKVYGRPGLMSSDPYFRSDHVALVERRCDTPETGRLTTDAMGTMTFIPHEEGDIYILRPPVKGHRYIMPTDIAGGVGKDYTVAAILDCTDKAEVAYFKSNQLDAELATLTRIIPLGKFYKAVSIPETNGEHGATHLNVLRAQKYRPIYRRKKWMALIKRYVDEYGYRTNEYGSRNRIYDSWAAALRANEWTISRDALKEARFVSEIEGRPDHPPGVNDDHFIAVGIGLTSLENQPGLGKRVIAPQQPVWYGEDAYQYAV